MADSKTESIEVNVEKKPKKLSSNKSTPQASKYLDAPTKNDKSDSKVSDTEDLTTNRQGQIIQPTKEMKERNENEKSHENESASNDSNEPENNSQSADKLAAATAEAAANLNSPVESEPVPGDHDRDEQVAAFDQDTDSEEMTVAAHATMQHQELLESRDYKINKKQLKRPPRRSSSHLHKTWVFLVLVTAVSVGLAFAYLTVIEGLSFEQITTRLGL